MTACFNNSPKLSSFRYFVNVSTNAFYNIVFSRVLALNISGLLGILGIQETVIRGL